MPEMLIDLASSLIHLDNKFWAKEQMEKSVESWLLMGGIKSLEQVSNLELMSLSLTIVDRFYIEKLNYCLTALGENCLLSIADSYYNRGVKYFQNQHYEAAIYEFNQVISINPNSVEAYSYRGKAYTKVGQYPEAKADLNRVLELQSENV